MSSTRSSHEIYTGSDKIVEYLIREKVKYIFGIPGHGCLGLTDALLRHKDQIQVIQPKQEMSGVHMAIGYYRVTGQPLAVFTSIGPGALNTTIGLADAFVDSMPVLVLTGDTHVHMRGVGVLQEIERKRDSALPRVLEPVVKRQFELAKVDQIPKVMQRAFNIMMTGRRGPVHIDLPMDIQCSPLKLPIPVPEKRKTLASPLGDPIYIQQAAEMLIKSHRPVIWIGGGVVSAKAFEEIKWIAEFLGAPVLTSMMAKDAFPNDHPLYGWATGSKGTKVGITLSRAADVVLAIGTRFADESTCSYRKGVAWNFGDESSDTRLIQIDIDPHEIGKNYPVDIGILGDAKAVLGQLKDILSIQFSPRDYQKSSYFLEITQLKKEWQDIMVHGADSSIIPVKISCVLQELRKLLPRNAIVVTSSGNAQAQLLQEFEFYEPYTNITAGGFSTMGYTLPATIGAKLGQPEKVVIGIVGDGDFLMTMQELHTACQLKLHIIIIVLNNAAWMAITDLQRAAFGNDHVYATEFYDRDGKLYTPHFADIAKAFGAWSTRISKQDEIQPTFLTALKQSGPVVIEIMVNRDPNHSGSPAWGWWDVPIPAYLVEKRQKYEKEILEEKLD